MIPLILTVALAFTSFLSSAFVILRIVIPILPPNPLSRRVPPSESGLPNFRSLTQADKAHIWLACLDLLALGFFVWQVLVESLATPSTISHDLVSTACLWIALTTRQTCLFFISALTLLYVRLGRSVSFGPKHCLLWAPTLVFVTGAGVGAVRSQVGVNTVWGGLVVYCTSIAVLTYASLGCVVATLLIIRHNVKMAAQTEVDDKEWPSIKGKLARRSITSDDIEALKEGSSWITSHRSSASSQRNSISAFSFSTTHHSAQDTTAPVTGSAPSILPTSSYWFGTATPNSAVLLSQDFIHPVPRVPSPCHHRPTTPPPRPNGALTDLSDPFHRNPRQAETSANSWLTSPPASQATLTGAIDSYRSYPTEYEHRVSRGTIAVQLLAESSVLGDYGLHENVSGLSPKASKDVDISVFHCVAWTASTWLPISLSLSYLFMASPSRDFSSSFAPLLLTLSVTVSAPLLALNLLLCAPLPIPVALFSRSYFQAPTTEARNSATEIRTYPEMCARSSSLTVVEGRRSGDVWIANGKPVDGHGKAARVLGLLMPSPRLAVLPLPKEGKHVEELTPPVPIPDESAVSMAISSPGADSAELGVMRTRKDSKASSYYSGADESIAYESQIMVAQRNFSAMATTVYLRPLGAQQTSVDNNASGTAEAMSMGVERTITRGHVCSQSASSSLQTPRTSMQSRFPLTPPASPLPPSPLNVRAFRHSRPQSSSGSRFSFGPIGHTSQIDSLSAGVVPLLSPGLKVGWDTVINDSSSPPRMRGGNEVKSKTPLRDDELGSTTSTSFNSPVMHSTPAGPGKRSGAANQWRHLSLPSLGLGEGGVHPLSI